jgi:hypothetical protein
MGSKAAIIDAADGRTVLGHIEDGLVRYEGGRGTIVGDAAHRLKSLLGHGYGRRPFHLVLPAIRLDFCRVVSPHVVFTYESAVELDEDDAPATVPDEIVDEDTDDGDNTAG